MKIKNKNIYPKPEINMTEKKIHNKKENWKHPKITETKIKKVKKTEM